MNFLFFFWSWSWQDQQANRLNHKDYPSSSRTYHLSSRTYFLPGSRSSIVTQSFNLLATSLFRTSVPRQERIKGQRGINSISSARAFFRSSIFEPQKFIHFLLSISFNCLFFVLKSFFEFSILEFCSFYELLLTRKKCSKNRTANCASFSRLTSPRYVRTLLELFLESQFFLNFKKFLFLKIWMKPFFFQNSKFRTRILILLQKKDACGNYVEF